LYLSDIIAVEEGNATFLAGECEEEEEEEQEEEKVVNFEKFNLLGTMFEHIGRFQDSKYDFERRQDVIFCLKQQLGGREHRELSEELLYERSLVLEPRGTC
jgi:hypothetical protein